MKPSEEDIEKAREIEKTLGVQYSKLYNNCLNNKPMSKRVSDLDLRDGCILTWNIFMFIIQNTQNKKELQ